MIILPILTWENVFFELGCERVESPGRWFVDEGHNEIKRTQRDVKSAWWPEQPSAIQDGTPKSSQVTKSKPASAGGQTIPPSPASRAVQPRSQGLSWEQLGES